MVRLHEVSHRADMPVDFKIIVMGEDMIYDMLTAYDEDFWEMFKVKADFDYQIECYVPQAKRKYGYFVLPILWNGKLVARMDCKADRKVGVLHVHSIYLESALKRIETFTKSLRKELLDFMHFNGCTTININDSLPLFFKETLSHS